MTETDGKLVARVTRQGSSKAFSAELRNLTASTAFIETSEKLAFGQRVEIDARGVRLNAQIVFVSSEPAGAMALFEAPSPESLAMLLEAPTGIERRRTELIGPTERVALEDAPTGTAGRQKERSGSAKEPKRLGLGLGRTPTPAPPAEPPSQADHWSQATETNLESVPAPPAPDQSEDVNLEDDALAEFPAESLTPIDSSTEVTAAAQIPEAGGTEASGSRPVRELGRILRRRRPSRAVEPALVRRVEPGEPPKEGRPASSPAPAPASPASPPSAAGAPTSEPPKRRTVSAVELDKSDLPQLEPDGATVRFATRAQYDRHYRANIMHGGLVLKAAPIPVGRQRKLTLWLADEDERYTLEARVTFAAGGTIGMLIESHATHAAALDALRKPR